MTLEKEAQKIIERIKTIRDDEFATRSAIDILQELQRLKKEMESLFNHILRKTKDGK